MICDNLGINEKGHLTFAGRDTVELAEKYGTPAYIMDEEKIREKCRIYKTAMAEYFGKDSFPLFASKSLCFKQIYRIMKEEDMGIDVVSPGELYTAAVAGFPLENAYFHGNNKTGKDIAYAMDHSIGYFVCDNCDELYAIDRHAKKRGIRQKILLRLTPGIDPHTHAKISTGKVDSKFGTAIETGQADELVRLALSLENIELRGYHCHIGSQIFDLDPFELAATVMLDLIKQVKDETGVQLGELNLGGGFGIKYLKSDRPRPYGDYMRKVSAAVNSYSKELGIETPFILIEPGRSIVGAAGITLYTVGAVKEIPDVRTYVSVDGGMGDNPRYALYQSRYEVVCANKASEKRSRTVTVAGKCCESGDLIQEWTHIQPVEPGDILAVLSTGAYNYSMASNYNRIPRLPVIMVKDGKERLVVRRETYEQLTECDI